jgi:DNA-binding NarL/FixJ family response regulator
MPRWSRNATFLGQIGCPRLQGVKSLVLVADDPTVVRNVRVVLRHAAGLRVAATIDGRFAVRARLSELRPDVVLIDEMCQRTNAFARLREVTLAAPQAMAVLLCDAPERAMVDDALAAGARAVLSRRAHPALLGAQLIAVANGAIVPLARRAGAQRWDETARTSA